MHKAWKGSPYYNPFIGKSKKQEIYRARLHLAALVNPETRLWSIEFTCVLFSYCASKLAHKEYGE
mgnify:FL=1